MRLYATLVLLLLSACTPANAGFGGGSFYDKADAVLTTATSTFGWSWVIDEDSFASNLDTKVPTQQSVKAYVDANAGSGLTPAYDTYANCAASTPDGVGDWCQSTDGPYRVESTDGATWNRTMYPGINFPVTPPSSSGWTAENSAAVTHVGGMRKLILPAGTGVAYRMERRALPAATGYWVDMCVVRAQSHNGEAGVAWWQTSDDKLIVAVSNDVSGGSTNHQDYTNVTTFSASNGALTGAMWGEIHCFRLHDDGTNRHVYLGSTAQASTDQTSVWPQLGANDARTNHITADAVAWGGYVGDADAAQHLYLVHYASGTYTP